MPCDLTPGVGTVASPHCEDGPACLPRPGPPPAAGGAQLGTLGPHVYKPKGCALGSQTHSMWLPCPVLWTKCGMAYLYLHQRDKLLHPSFVLKLLLCLLYLFLTLWSPENFYDDYLFLFFTELF
uniref:Uncharacterized protein n=1 Tax=Pipistrellus kuhlii TaxID=59472 RepID=A0A7J8B166_PIPKU|nr:hypothetical protein mPipKuh1_007754 [Pipistrellus kuhlii]